MLKGEVMYNDICWGKMNTDDIIDLMYEGTPTPEVKVSKKDHDVKSVKIDIAKLGDRIEEDRVVEDIYKREFVEWLSKNDISFDYIVKIIESEKMNSIIKYNFNQILLSAKTDINFDIYKIILYIYENIGMLRKILILIDDDVKQIIREELAEKYKIQLKSGSIMELMSIYKL